MEDNLQKLLQKLATLKVTLNCSADNLTLEDYDCLHGEIEDIQYFVCKMLEDNA